MDVEALKNELMETEWRELLKRARVEYQIKVLPTDKRVDVINKILQRSANSPAPAVSVPKGDTVRPGYARIILHEVAGEPDPFYIHINGYNATIPRNVEVEVPHEILPTLDKCLVYKGSAPDADGVQTPYFRRRATFTVIQKDDSVPSGKLQFTVRREKSLEKKRKFFDKFDFWPTDGEMKEYLRTAGRDSLYS